MSSSVNSIYCFTFLIRLLILRSINETLKYFTDYFNSTNNEEHSLSGYIINCFFFNIYVIEDGATQRQILKSEPILTGFNENFNSSHGLKHTINNIDTTHPLWSILHNSVKDALCKVFKPGSSESGSSQNLINKLDDEIYLNLGKEICYAEFVDEFCLKWFHEFMVGSGEHEEINYNDFSSLRKDILSVLDYTFYSNPFRKVPIIGSYISLWRRYYAQNKINHIKAHLKWMIPRLKEKSFLYEFRQSIQTKIIESKLDLDADDVFIDNAFISILVYDFMSIVFKGILLERIIRGTKIDDHDLSNILRQNFLFPFRGRAIIKDVQTKDLGLIKSGDLCLLNLVSDQAKTLFSFGPRSCPGQMMVNPLLKAYIKKINELEFIPTSNTDEIHSKKINRSSDSDMPFIVSKMRGLIRDPNIINKKDIIPVHFRDDKIDPHNVPLRNIWAIYSNKNLMADILQFFKRLPEMDFDIIVAPEARALPLAGMISCSTNLPIIVMTKTDKFGPTESEDYSRGHTDEKTTIHMYKSFEDSIEGKRVLFVDDGLASGGTSIACINLIEKMGGNVTQIFVIVRHNYCILEKEYEEKYLKITHCCYSLDSIGQNNMNSI